MTIEHHFIDHGIKQLFIGGRWQAAVSGETFACMNPSTGAPIVDVAKGGAADIELAVVAARKALDGDWAAWKPFDRQSLLLRIADAVEARFDDLHRLESLDMGAPVARTSQFLRWIRQTFQYYAAQAVAPRGQVYSNSVPGDYLSYSLRVPVGVVGAIIPWNGPLITQLWSICPVLATGCTLVLKPAEEAPLSALMLAEIMAQAGVPDGVINVVPGPGPTAGAALAEHPDVDKITFTGSTPTGRRIVEAAARNMKRVSVELGGKSPNIVFADADLDAAAMGAAMACFSNSGQVCYAGSRLFVERSIYPTFVEKVAEHGRALRIGPALDPATQLGPLASRQHFDRVRGYLDIAREDGARVVSGGSAQDAVGESGYFVSPTVLADVDNSMRIAREEVFGPVLCAIPFEGEDEVLRLAHDTQYGLGGGVWSRDIARSLRIATALRCGMTWSNCYGVTDPAVTFTGAKMSGYGVKGGPFHLGEYTLEKTIWMNFSQN